MKELGFKFDYETAEQYVRKLSSEGVDATDDDIIDWWLKTVGATYKEGDFSCLHLDAEVSLTCLMLGGVVCPDCGRHLLGRAELTSWIRRVLYRGRGRISVKQYDLKGNVIREWMFTGVYYIHDELTLISDP